MAVVEGEIYSLGGYDNINNIYLSRHRPRVHVLKVCNIFTAQ
jgi:hypothetical protein